MHYLLTCQLEIVVHDVYRMHNLLTLGQLEIVVHDVYHTHNLQTLGQLETAFGFIGVT
jgi:hypothetical protein